MLLGGLGGGGTKSHLHLVIITILISRSSRLDTFEDSLMYAHIHLYVHAYRHYKSFSSIASMYIHIYRIPPPPCSTRQVSDV